MSETNNETAVRSRATSTTSPSKAKLTPLVPGKEDPNRPLVELTHVEKHFGALHVLKDINLTVAKGEVLVVVGPSGSGKSTMCRTINRLETIDSGDIRIDGKPLPQEGKELANLRAEVGMVFQSFNLFANKTILENVTLALIKVRHMDKKEAEQLAMDLLARVGVDSQASKMPSQLSGGQQQRIAIARALAENKRVFVDVTADWCVTCKANKYNVLLRDDVQDALSAPDVVALRGDWSRPSDTISQFLTTRGSAPVPFNQIYGPGLPQGHLLPALLSREAVLSTLSDAKGK